MMESKGGPLDEGEPLDEGGPLDKNTVLSYIYILMKC